MIRIVDASELERLREIEVAAGAAFADIGMDEVASDAPPPVATLASYQRDGRAWVCVDEARRSLVVGYVLAEEIDGCGYVEQVSVHPDYARRRIGRDLIDVVETWSMEMGLSAMTLTTFVEVPWNGPYYQRCGFRFLQDDELTPGLLRIRAEEATAGLDRWPRACMRREVPSRGDSDGSSRALLYDRPMDTEAWEQA